jgi:hypothetical protein
MPRAARFKPSPKSIGGDWLAFDSATGRLCRNFEYAPIQPPVIEPLVDQRSEEQRLREIQNDMKDPVKWAIRTGNWNAPKDAELVREHEEKAAAEQGAEEAARKKFEQEFINAQPACKDIR